MKKKNIYFFAYSYKIENSLGFGNFKAEFAGALSYQDIQKIELDISKRIYDGKATIVISNFIKLEGE